MGCTEVKMYDHDMGGCTIGLRNKWFTYQSSHIAYDTNSTSINPLSKIVISSQINYWFLFFTVPSCNYPTYVVL